MRKRIIVIGLGRFGAALAESLSIAGCEVIAIDRDMHLVDAIKQKVAYAIELDASDPIALASVDAAACQTAVVAIGEGFEGAALAVAALRELGVPEVIARAQTPRHARIMSAAGAHRVIEIEAEMGRALGSRLMASECGKEADALVHDL
jgi:trk system potassium uptake protein TrkA